MNKNNSNLLLWFSHNVLKKLKNKEGKHLTWSAIIIWQCLCLMSKNDPKNIYVKESNLAEQNHYSTRQLRYYLKELNEFGLITKRMATVSLKDRKIGSSLIVSITLPQYLPLLKSDCMEKQTLRLYKYLLQVYFTEPKELIIDQMALAYHDLCKVLNCVKDELIGSLKQLNNLDLITMQTTESVALISITTSCHINKEDEAFILNIQCHSKEYKAGILC